MESMQELFKRMEEELRVRNFSPRTVESYMHSIKTYFAFKREHLEQADSKSSFDFAQGKSPQAASMIVLDLGAGSGKVYFVHEGKLVGVHSIASLGGEGVTKRIAGASNAAFETIEAQKREGAVSLPDEIITQAAREVSSLISAHVHASTLSSAPCVVVGGGARMHDLTTAFRTAFARTVTLGEPFHHVAYPQILKDTLTRTGGAYAPSVAVAFAAVGLSK